MEDLEIVMAVRSEQYARLACTVADLIVTARDPARMIVLLLMDAYRDGGRDMHAQVKHILDSQMGDE